MFRYLLAFLVLLYGVTRFAPLLLNSIQPMISTVVLGFVFGVLVGVFLVYRQGWNARGDEDERQAIEGIRKKNQAGKI